MADRNFESPSPKLVSSPKRGVSPENQQNRNPPKRLQSTGANERDTEESSNGDYISDDRRSLTPINNSPEPQQLSSSAKALPSIEDSHNPGYREDNVPSLAGMNDTIVDAIKRDSNQTSSASPELATFERHISFTSPTQRSGELTAEDDENSSSLPHSASTTLPSPIQPQIYSPSPSLFLAELPNLSPTPASSTTVSSTPSASNRITFSPPPASVASTSTSISEGDSDEEDWDDQMFNLWNEALAQNPGPDVDVLGLVLEAMVGPQWQGAALVPDLGVTFVDDGEDEYSSQGDDNDTETDNNSNSHQGVPQIFAPRYSRWPDFDASDDERTTNYYSFSDESVDDAELDVDGIRYPGMNVFRVNDYAFTRGDRVGPRDQQFEVIYSTDDEDNDSDGGDPEWDFGSETETTEAQWWGGDLWIVYYDPFCMCP